LYGLPYPMQHDPNSGHGGRIRVDDPAGNVNGLGGDGDGEGEKGGEGGQAGSYPPSPPFPPPPPIHYGLNLPKSCGSIFSR
jgi:hypothetical protein